MKNNKLVEFEGLLVNLKESMENMSNYIQELGREQSRCDRELIDLEHFTEFLDADDKEAIVIFKEIKRTITRRREIKDILSQVESIYGTFSKKVGGVDGVQESLDKFQSQKVGLSERKYKPRIRMDLFEKLKR